MKIHQLEYFLACIEYGSFKDAAEQMYVTPQAISKAIASLEIELNDKLFERSNQSVIPTDTALKLAKMSKEVVVSFKFIEGLFKSSDEQQNRAYILGTAFYPCHGALLSDDVIGALEKRIDGTALKVHKYPQHKCEEALREGMIDAAISINSIHDHDIDSYKLAEAPLGFIMSSDHILSDKETIRFKDLGDFKIAEPMNVKLVYSELTNMFQRAGYALEFTPISPTIESHIEFIREGGIVLAQESSSILKECDDVVFRNGVISELPKIPLFFCRSRSSSASISLHIIEELKEILA